MARGVQHVHYNKLLTNVSIEFFNPELIAERIFPRLHVENETDLYYEFDKSSFNVVEDLRADGAPENESTGGWVVRNYQIEPHGLRDKITKRMRNNADKGLNLEVSTTNRLTKQLRNGLEYRVVGPGGVLRTDANNVAVISPDLTGINADPRGVVTTAISTIQRASGVQPNTLVMNPEVLRAITLTAQYKDEFKHVTDIRNSDLPETLYGLKIVQATALGNLNSSGVPIARGLATTLNYMMGDDIWVGYVKDGPLGMQDLTFGTLFYTQQYSRKWHDETNEVDWIAVDDDYVAKVIAKECGYLIKRPFNPA